MRKLSIFLFMILLIINTAYSAIVPLECSFKNACGADEVNMEIYGSSKYYADVGNDILSSPVQLNLQDANYDWPLCCRTDFPTDLVPRNVGLTTSCDNPFLFFTENTNARAGFYRESGFDFGHYSYKSCLETTDQFFIDIVVEDTFSTYYENLGYDCIYRTSGGVNGLVSSCEVTFNPPFNDIYTKTVWARLFESEGSLQCNSDCTSKLDGRVYSACASQVNNCEAVPVSCDGSLLEGWLEFNESHEFQCSEPWIVTRVKPISEQVGYRVDVKGECKSVISEEKPVNIDNEQYVMKIFICQD